MGQFGDPQQLDLGIGRIPEQDRNFHLGGRSFYFFDFDDNIMYLGTPIILFHKDSGEELPLSSGHWAHVHHTVGKAGPFAEYEVRDDDTHGSFKHFRDHGPEILDILGVERQKFIHDLIEALDQKNRDWRGPSWECFYHATFNQRPISLITARGHHPETMRDGISEMVRRGLLPSEPNYMSLFPVSHPGVRESLGDPHGAVSVAELKQRAIARSVEQAFKTYGHNPHHRFGMSDDDPKNLDLIFQEMRRLKKLYPENSFFIIETHKGQFVKHEVGLNDTRGEFVPTASQLDLFSPR